MARTTNQATIVGAFENRTHAQDAIRELKEKGFTEAQIGLISHRDEVSGKGIRTDDAVGSHAAEGAMTGVAAGAGVGALWGLGIAAGFLPAIGPIIAGGALASILASAAAGAAVAGVGGALIGLGVPEEEADYFQSEFKSGRTLVTVHAGNRCDDASAILRRHGGYDVQTKDSYRESSEYRQKVASSSAPTMTAGQCSSATHADSQNVSAGSTACSTSTGESSGRTKTQTSDKATVQLKEEQANVQKDTRSAGEVRVRKEVVTEHRSIDVPVEREEIVIERHAPSTQRTAGTVQAGEEVRIPLKQEEVRVQKVPVVKEEVTIAKQKVPETKHVDVELKHEELHVDEQGKPRVRKN